MGLRSGGRMAIWSVRFLALKGKELKVNSDHMNVDNVVQLIALKGKQLNIR